MSTLQGLFGGTPTVSGRAPGRVNLLGEHTDYNDGFVLPTPIPQSTRVQLARRPGRTVRAASAGQGGAVQTYVLGQERPVHGWLDYVQGVTHVLSAEGYALTGVDLLVASDVPMGAGLSSSAALTVSLLRGLREAFGLQGAMDDVKLALLARQVENQFVGAAVGIMDPMVCSLGEAGSALFLDTRSLEFQHVPLPANADLVVIHSGVVHQLSTGDYNTRRQECQRAGTLLGVRALRDLTSADLARLTRLPDVLARRVRHVVTENERVLAAVECLRTGAVERLGELLNASHASQRDDYDVSVPAIDLLVSLAQADSQIFGARLTGGGFGGSIVALAHAGAGTDAAARIARRYAKESGNQPTVLVPVTPLP